MVRPHFYFFILVFTLAAACLDSPRDVKKAVAELKVGPEPDSCSFCIGNEFVASPFEGETIEAALTIDYPVAIEFFNKVGFVHKYDGKGQTDYDTLVRLLKIKQSWNRTKIYDLTEQFNYYHEGIRPILKKSAVTIIDTLSTTRFITLTSGDETYVIDLAAYNENDGVFMYQPGKKPIFWTMTKDEENCFTYFGFAQWYFNCERNDLVVR